ncbi:hypothetical protein BCR37DRAFT_381204 [Protomyces lactucae-debilis]|uniref:NADH dehydrogenase [ubiquinone] 1 alpha subcomplex subunit 1 n=1 Tax=Protomyces lactucae-debilis TaxID=2754530 RepID=A0A1Y2F9A5_PROLT|nr:uncharacterized protein BCR37DRAFT_381204 [Protomyces lactucae-debilis]ORY80512.1 hypothetical protein BCR37DRAFT_381204 [Protomyces lactucae-debilis]
MPVPFEALLPFGIIIGMYTAAGGLLGATKTLSNEGKAHRYNLDVWERQMMERDRRLTGTLRGQSASPKADPAFAVNSQWKIEKRMY